MGENRLSSKTKPGKKVWVAPSFEIITIKSRKVMGINYFHALASP